MQKKFILKKDGFRSKINSVSPTNFTINYENELNTAQYRAVISIDGTFLVIAGAGTGKTRTLVFRVARLIEMGVEPKSILLLTFTRKAAKEMMNRASQILDDRAEKVNGGTFHSFANLTLRKYGSVVGLNQNFLILDQGDSEDTINLIRSQMKLGDEKKRFPTKATLLKIYSLSTNTERTILDILEEDYPHLLEFSEKIEEIRKQYELFKQKHQSLDYDDLLIYLNKFLISESPIVEQFLQNIEYIMVDEYQDTNKIQAEIIINLAKFQQNIMVVGDDSQSIYRFRGADFRNIMEFPELFENTEIIKLEENYRSTQGILDVANKVITNSYRSFSKNLFTQKTSDELPILVSSRNEKQQSQFIVENILDLREQGIPLNEIAILFRASTNSFDLELELTKYGIPFVKFGGMKLIESAHIKDILAFIRIAENPKDLVSWFRVLTLHEGVGQRKAQQMIEVIGNLEINFEADVIKFDDKNFNKFETLLQLFYQLKNKHRTPTEMVEIVYAYYEPIFREKFNDFNKRKKDIEIFANIATNYRTVESFLAEMALDPPKNAVVDVEAENNDNEYVVLSTIHSAKGLEWNSVFVIHAVEGFFPSSQSLNNPEAIDEERRLMYVAVTRAKKNLFVIYPMQLFDRFAGFTFSKPSRFITELTEDIVENWVVEEE